MKTILLRMLCIAYGFTSLMVLGLAILMPFGYGMKDAPPLWTAWILYPLALLIMGSQEVCIKYFNDKNAI